MKKLLSISCILILQFLALNIFAANIVPQPPTISASNYLLLDAKSGQVLAEKGIDEKINPASITKMMTSYVIADSLKKGRISVDDEVFISENAYKAEGSRTFVEINTRVKIMDLIRGLVIQSGNDAAIALAEHLAGSEDAFVQTMNSYAKELGMQNTSYANSTGFTDENHYTTARDIAILSKALINNHPKHYAIYKEKEFSYNGIKQNNRNNLLWRDDAIDGIKTGHTEAAGYCLAASAEKKGMRLISVVLGTKSSNARINASQTLLNYGFSFYEAQTLYTPDKEILQQKIWKAEEDTISLRVNEPVHVTIPRGRYQDLKISSNISSQIVAPVNKATALGTLDITLDGTTIASAKLYPAQDIAEAGFFKRSMDGIKLWFAD